MKFLLYRRVPSRAAGSRLEKPASWPCPQNPTLLHSQGKPPFSGKPGRQAQTAVFEAERPPPWIEISAREQNGSGASSPRTTVASMGCDRDRSISSYMRLLERGLEPARYLHPPPPPPPPLPPSACFLSASISAWKAVISARISLCGTEPSFGCPASPTAVASCSLPTDTPLFDSEPERALSKLSLLLRRCCAQATEFAFECALPGAPSRLSRFEPAARRGGGAGGAEWWECECSERGMLLCEALEGER